MSHQIVIVGAGPGGCAAAVQCKRLGMSPLLLDKTGVAGGLLVNAFCVENYPGIESPINGRIFARRLGAQLDRFEIPIHKEAAQSVVSAANGCWTVSTDQRQIEVNCVVLATGTVPMELGTREEQELKNRSLLFYDVCSLFEKHPRPMKVAIIGGGEASLDYALSLAQIGCESDIYSRKNGNAGGRLVELVDDTPRIQWKKNTAISELTYRKDRVTVGYQPSFSNGSGFCQGEYDAILVAIGRRNTIGALLSPFENTPVPQGSSERCEVKSTVKSKDASKWIHHLTPAPGLFICGDGRLNSLGQAGIAVGDGLEVAAMAVNRTKEGHR